MTQLLEFNNIFQLPLLCLYLLAFIILLAYYFKSFSKLAFAKLKASEGGTPSVSVIISARNEALNLSKNLQHVLEQDYPDFQVVVVNDCSWDESEQVLDALEQKYKHLKVVTIQFQEKYIHGKKFALTLGIKAAAHDTLLFTDADCVPNSKNWLRSMVGNFTESKHLILGYGAYEKRQGILNKLIRFDTFQSALQYLSYAMNGNAYMGVGRNLGYHRSLFFNNKGFANHQHILSGDDDLFVNETTTQSNTSVEVHPDAFTISKPKDTFGEWSTQKTRHMSTSKHYPTKHQFTLGLFWAAQVIFILSLIGLLVLQFDWRVVLGIFALKIGAQYLIYGKAMQKLKEQDLIWMLPFLDLTMMAISPIFAIQGLLYKDHKWK